MQHRSLIAPTMVACLHVFCQPGIAASPELAYRVLQGTHACLPCGAASYAVIDSLDTVEAFHTELKEKCHDPQAPDLWRQSIIDLGVDLRDEAIVTMYEVIGTGGKPSLRITGPEGGILEAAIEWDTGPPPHAPIATAACFTFAVLKSAVTRIDVMPGGVLNKSREKLPLGIR
jgi:hypothetical protein